jgi:hypothetical protein
MLQKNNWKPIDTFVGGNSQNECVLYAKDTSKYGITPYIPIDQPKEQPK